MIIGYLRKSIIIVTLSIFISGCSKEVVYSSNIDPYNTDTYYGYLEIPRISLYLGFFNEDSPLNDVNKNIYYINPNIKNTYLLAAHSGSGILAYFNNLKYLKIGDELKLIFKDKTLTYKVSDIRREEKNGTIHIKRKENCLILTTCDKRQPGYQLIIEGKM